MNLLTADMETCRQEGRVGRLSIAADNGRNGILLWTKQYVGIGFRRVVFHNHRQRQEWNPALQDEFRRVGFHTHLSNREWLLKAGMESPGRGHVYPTGRNNMWGSDFAGWLSIITDNGRNGIPPAGYTLARQEGRVGRLSIAADNGRNGILPYKMNFVGRLSIAANYDKPSSPSESSALSAGWTLSSIKTAIKTAELRHQMHTASITQIST